MKKCRDCGLEKPLSDFYVKERRRYATRYFSRCKPCYYAWIYAKDKRQGFRWHGPRQKNGGARRKLSNARKSGRVVKPLRCEECGATPERRRLHGHHHRGYGRPLDVRWLCENCHRIAHAV